MGIIYSKCSRHACSVHQNCDISALICVCLCKKTYTSTQLAIFVHSLCKTWSLQSIRTVSNRDSNAVREDYQESCSNGPFAHSQDEPDDEKAGKVRACCMATEGHSPGENIEASFRLSTERTGEISTKNEPRTSSISQPGSAEELSFGDTQIRGTKDRRLFLAFLGRKKEMRLTTKQKVTSCICERN